MTPSTALLTPLPPYRASPSRSSTASKAPVDAPEGTAARPSDPSSRMTSTSTVGLPRESRISRAPMNSMLATGAALSCADLWALLAPADARSANLPCCAAGLQACAKKPTVASAYPRVWDEAVAPHAGNARFTRQVGTSSGGRATDACGGRGRAPSSHRLCLPRRRPHRRHSGRLAWQLCR